MSETTEIIAPIAKIVALEPKLSPISVKSIEQQAESLKEALKSLEHTKDKLNLTKTIGDLKETIQRTYELERKHEWLHKLNPFNKFSVETNRNLVIITGIVVSILFLTACAMGINALNNGNFEKKQYLGFFWFMFAFTLILLVFFGLFTYNTILVTTDKWECISNMGLFVLSIAMLSVSIMATREINDAETLSETDKTGYTWAFSVLLSLSGISTIGGIGLLISTIINKKKLNK